MTALSRAFTNPTFIAYLGAFLAAAVACFASAWRARHIQNRDTRRGLTALLLTSGGWALVQAAFLAVPTQRLKIATYILGLILGFSTVGPWLYFCSAYTGRTLHRNRAMQRIAVGVFLAVALVKVTNPVHGIYFSATVVESPFPHLAVQSGVLHWVVVGFTYALAAVGYFMLVELFWQVGYNAWPFVVLFGLTGLPVIPDIIGVLSDQVPDIVFEPLGVAVFAVGVLFLYFEEFQAIQLTGGRDDPIIMLDDDNRIREYNEAAGELFADLETGKRIDTAVPQIPDSLASDGGVVEIERVGGLQYYQLASNPFTTDLSRLGRVITLTDITEREEYRTELERQNERLEQFAATVSHDLRNPLNVATNRLELARDDGDTEHQHLDAVANAHTRMEALIEDVLSLARQGQPIDETESVQLSSIATQCWDLIETVDGDLVVDSDLTVTADGDRLQQLLENLFRNAIDHGGTDVTIRIGALDEEPGFYVADDGGGITPAERDTVFEYGHTTATDGTGFGLAIVNEIAEAHGWTVQITDSENGGARFEVSTTSTG